MNQSKQLIEPMPKDASEWLNFIFTRGIGQKGEDRLVYVMDDMQYPELQSLISSGVSYPPSGDPKGYCMPKWVSDNRLFDLYNRLFTVLQIERSLHWKEKVLIGIRVRIQDIDDGDEVYLFETNDGSKADEIVEYFKNKYSENPVLDTAALREDFTTLNFKRD
jgi:hypothetical protein